MQYPVVVILDALLEIRTLSLAAHNRASRLRCQAWAFFANNCTWRLLDIEPWNSYMPSCREPPKVFGDYMVPAELAKSEVTRLGCRGVILSQGGARSQGTGLVMKRYRIPRHQRYIMAMPQILRCEDLRCEELVGLAV